MTSNEMPPWLALQTGTRARGMVCTSAMPASVSSSPSRTTMADLASCVWGGGGEKEMRERGA